MKGHPLNADARGATQLLQDFGHPQLDTRGAMPRPAGAEPPAERIQPS